MIKIYYIASFTKKHVNLRGDSILSSSCDLKALICMKSIIEISCIASRKDFSLYIEHRNASAIK